MKFRILFSLFLCICVKVTAMDLPSRVKCIDQNCNGIISTARVVRTITKVISDELKSIEAGQTVGIFAKSADKSNTLIGILHNNMKGFVDVSFIKELNKDKNNNLVETDLPKKFQIFLKPRSEPIEKVSDPTEDEPEIKPPSKPKTNTPPVKDSTEDTAELKDSMPSNKVPPSSPDAKLDLPKAKDQGSQILMGEIKNSPESPVQNIGDKNKMNGLPKPFEDKKVLENFKPEFQTVNNNDNLIISEAPKATPSGQNKEDMKHKPIEKPVDITKDKKLDEQNQQLKVNADFKDSAQGNSPSHLSKKEDDEKAIPSVDIKTDDKAQFSDTKKEESVQKVVNFQVSDGINPQNPEVFPEKKDEPDVKKESLPDSLKNENVIGSSVDSERKKVPEVFPEKKDEPDVKKESLPDSLKNENVIGSSVDSERKTIPESDIKPEIREESQPVVPEGTVKDIKTEVDQSTNNSNLTSDQISNSVDKEQQNDQQLSNIDEEMSKSEIIRDDKSLNASKSISEGKSLPTVSDSERAETIQSTNDVEDPWVYHNSESQFTQCIQFIANSSGTLKALKRLLDAILELLNKLLSAFPDTLRTIIKHDIPKFLGLPYELTMVSSFLFSIVFFMSITFRCCLCRKDWKKGMTQCQDAILTLEGRLEEKNKANIELSEWNGRLAKQLKEYENQIELMKLDSSVQVKEISKQYEIMEGCYTTSQNELERLRSELMSAESKLIDERRSLERRLEEECDKLSKCITEKEDKLLLNEVEYERQVTMVSELTSRQEQLISQTNAYYDQMVLMKNEAEINEEEKARFEEHIQHLNSELTSIQESFQELSVFEALLKEESSKNNTDLKDDDESEDENSEDDTTDLTNGLENNEEHKSKILEKVKEFIDASKLRSELKECTEKIVSLESRLRLEITSRNESEEKLSQIESEKRAIQSDRQVAELSSIESQKKLDILTQYFKERESEMQRLIGEQEVLKSMTHEEASSFKAKSELLDNEMKTMRDKLNGMHKELEDSERAYRRQVVELEKRAHENWLAARGYEREVKELKEETQSLRQRLLEAERSKLPFPPRGMPPNLLSNRFPRPPLPMHLSGTTSPPLVMPNMLPPPSLRSSFPKHPSTSQASIGSMAPPSESSQSERDRPPSRASAATSNLSHRMPSLIPQGMPRLPVPPMGLPPLPPGMTLPPPPPFGILPPFTSGNMPQNNLNYFHDSRPSGNS